MSDWVHALRINGDFRGRYEAFFADHPDFVDRYRWRYRLRLGVVATLHDNFEVGLRLGSGDLDDASNMRSGSDPISNNQTLQNNASKKGVFLDQAYAKWSPVQTPDWAGTLIAGKMENPFVFSDMVFDPDYTPEGAAVQLGWTIDDRQALRFIGGLFVLDEMGGSSADPYLGGAQVRWDATWHRRLVTTAGVAALSIANAESLSNAAVPNVNRGNTRVGATGVPAYDFNPIVADAAFTYTLDSFLMYAGTFPIRFLADYVNNPAADDDNDGYSVGVQFGKAGKKKTYELAYTYKHLGADAWYEEVVDSDFGAFYEAAPAGGSTGYGAGTNVKGHIVKFSYSPYDSLTLSVKWFGTELINPVPAGADSLMNRVQVDAFWKF
jgi:hypothetical protein